MRLAIVAAVSVLGIGVAAPLRAEEVAAAEALFRRGLEAMEAGRYAEACAALAESHRLDPRPGALFTLAECRSKEKKIATAVALYDDYLSAFAALSPADQARQRGREKIAAEKKRVLGPRVPKLVLRLPPGVNAKVTRDDVALRPPALGIPLPVDPGEHTITIQLDGGSVRRQSISIGPDEEKTVDLEAAQPQAPKLEAPPPPPVRPMVEQAPPPARRPPAEDSRRPYAYAALGLGAAGVVLGAATGAVVLVKRGTVGSNCYDRVCTSAGLAAANSAKPLGSASTAGFVVGGAGLVTAAILFLTDRPSEAAPSTASWRPVFGNVASRGAFVGARKEW